MKGKKIAVRVITIVVIIILLTSVPIPFLPFSLTPMEFLRYWLVYNFDIDIFQLPQIVPLQKPEIDIKGKIAFSFITFAEEGKIYIGGVENKKIYLLAKDLRIYNDMGRGDLAWSPNGQIIFTGPIKLEQAGNNIYVLNMRGEIRRLTKLEGIEAQTLSFSPDGKKFYLPERKSRNLAQVMGELASPTFIL